MSVSIAGAQHAPLLDLGLQVPAPFCPAAGFNPLQKTGSYAAAAAQLHQRISVDKPWYLLDPEVIMLKQRPTQEMHH